jgi:predicted ATP-grasp superfamily ATP-dependent carboligase
MIPQASHTTGRHLSILLSEGSSLSARQTLYALGPAGHVIDVCDPRSAMCLARFSRHVRACHRCPSFTADPDGYLTFLEARLRATHYDVLLPTHDQVYLLAGCRDRLGVLTGLPVPEFAALERLQSKASFVRLLHELALPHPPTTIVHTRAELQEACTFPCYVKLSHSTAGCGVWYLGDATAMRVLGGKLEAEGLLSGASEVVVQQPASGTLGVAQSVFQKGRLVAAHCYMARALGVGGSARARVSVSHPIVIKHLASLGAHLHWHGALMLDYLWDEVRDRPEYIEANPRIGETFNATQSGVNLCELLLQVGLGITVPAAPPSRPGIRTHSLLMTLLAAGERGQTRRRLLRELATAGRRTGIYENSEDEVTRWRDDPPSLIPAAYLTARLLLNPRHAAAVIKDTVDNYALTARAARAIRELAGTCSAPNGTC